MVLCHAAQRTGLPDLQARLLNQTITRNRRAFRDMLSTAMDSESAVPLAVSEETIAMPGEVVGTISGNPPGGGTRRVVRLGSGVRYHDQSLVATKAGNVRKDPGRSKVWIAGNQKRYEPVTEDAVVGIVIEKHADEYRLDIRGTDTAILPALAFEGATKRNKPALAVGSSVYCRIATASKDMDIEASCIAPGSSQSWVSGETLYSELKGGNIVTVSTALARALRNTSSAVLAALETYMRFEVAIGANGRVWVKSDSIQNTIVLCLLIAKADEMPVDKWQAHAKQVLDKFKSA
jgi:exosome complex component RRP40